MTTKRLSKAAVEGRKRLRAVIYTRISRDDSGEGVANQRQEEDCRTLASLRPWDVVAVENDIAISGYGTKKRPAWERVLGMIERGEVDVVIAWHMDRMTRNMRDLEELITIAEERGVGIATVNGDIDLTNDTGRMVARILAAVARAEVERKGARQRRANLQRARAGVFKHTGFRAFGYTQTGEVVEDEAALIREAAEMILNGAPLRAVVRHWTELEVPTPRSRRNMAGWTHNSVRAILLNPRNAGIATYNGEVVGKGQWEPIISEATHVLLVAKLTDPARSKGDKTLGNKPKNLLSGIALCGECGWKVEAGSSEGRKVYKCSNPEGDHLTTIRDEAEEMVRTALVAAAPTFGSIVTDGKEPREPGVPAALWEQRETINERLNQLAVSFATGVLTPSQLEVASAALTAQLAEVEEEIEEAANDDRAPYDDTLAEVFKLFDMDLWGQRRVLSEVATIKLWPKNRRRNVPMDQQVTVHLRTATGEQTPVLDKRQSLSIDPASEHVEKLARLLVEQQPEGVDTLAKAAQWLVDNGHTDRARGGLPGKLSPLVRFVRGETRGATGWTHKREVA